MEQKQTQSILRTMCACLWYLTNTWQSVSLYTCESCFRSIVNRQMALPMKNVAMHMQS